MLVKVIKMFKDKETKEIRNVNDVFECEDKLAEERIKTKYVQKVENKKENKKDKRED